MKNKYLLFIFLTLTIPFCINAQNHSMHFDGSDDYINIGNHLNLEHTSSFTLEAWIKTNNSTGFLQIISKLDSELSGWAFQLANGTLSFFYSGSVTSGNATVSDNIWHHVALVWNVQTTTLSFYLDNNLDSTTKYEFEGTFINSGDVCIGAYDANGSPEEFWDGQLDEIRVWNRALSSTELANNANAELDGTQQDLLLYYKFDQTNSSCDVVDASVNALHGTRVGNGALNNLPQFSKDVPAISIVANANSNSCIVQSFENLGSAEEITLYPNPSDDFLQVSGLKNAEGYQVYNSLGIEIAHGIISNQEKIQVKHLSNGLYFVKFESGRLLKFIKE
ncbi:MAG: T9SS type A sorting domain-containing protein [Marinilabiliaceae bacterium]|nr:T9SS type A sorting domain-containing protein [Marinilabiliaceae bacterium]